MSDLEQVPDACGSDAAERQVEQDELKRQIVEYLKSEPRLTEVFECQWLGISRRSEIRRRLGMDEEEVIRARRRLKQRLAAFAKLRGEATANRRQ